MGKQNLQLLRSWADQYETVMTLCSSLGRSMTAKQDDMVLTIKIKK